MARRAARAMVSANVPALRKKKMASSESNTPARINTGRDAVCEPPPEFPGALPLPAGRHRLPGSEEWPPGCPFFWLSTKLFSVLRDTPYKTIHAPCGNGLPAWPASNLAAAWRCFFLCMLEKAARSGYNCRGYPFFKGKNGKMGRKEPSPCPKN